MDFTVLNRGEKIAGISGILLILIMFIFDWYGLKGAPDQFGGLNAWDAYSFIDIILFITALAAIALAVLAASDFELGLPVAVSAVVTGLGILAVVLILFRIISSPSYDIGFGGGEIDTSIRIGVILGLFAAAGIAVGGWLGMQEEGTTFSDQADRVRGGGTGTGPGAGSPPPPPPPPPPTQPPPSAGP